MNSGVNIGERISSSTGERILAVELLASLFFVWVSLAREKGRAPSPSEILDVVLAFGLLSALAMFGNQAARIAAAFGALLMLALMLHHGKGFAGAVSSVTGTGPTTVQLVDMTSQMTPQFDASSAMTTTNQPQSA